MKRIAVRSMLVLLAVAICAGCDLVKETEIETFSTTDDFAVLYVQSAAGMLDILTDSADGQNFAVEVEKYAWGCTSQDALRDLERITVTTERIDNTYRIVVESPYDEITGIEVGFHGGADITVVGLPKEVQIVQVAGAIYAEEVAGGSISAAAGQVQIAACSDDVTIDAAAGDVSIDSFTGEQLDIAAAAGSVDLAVEGSGRLDGAVEMAAGELTLDIAATRSCDLELGVMLGGILIFGGPYDLDGRLPGIDVQATATIGAGEGLFTAEAAVGTFYVTVD